MTFEGEKPRGVVSFFVVYIMYITKNLRYEKHISWETDGDINHYDVVFFDLYVGMGSGCYLYDGQCL